MIREVSSNKLEQVVNVLMLKKVCSFLKIFKITVAYSPEFGAVYQITNRLKDFEGFYAIIIRSHIIHIRVLSNRCT